MILELTLLSLLEERLIEAVRRQDQGSRRRDRLVCSGCGNRDCRYGGDRYRAAVALTAPPYLKNPPADRSQ
jgi:hypothetical protein